jgi:hypothetical protein
VAGERVGATVCARPPYRGNTSDTGANLAAAI